MSKKKHILEDRHGNMKKLLLHQDPEMRNTPEQFYLPQLPPRDQRTYDVPYDEEIQDGWISLVDRGGVYHPRVSLDETMRAINRLTEHLVQVTPADPDTGKLATCKVYSKIQLKAAHAAKKRLARGAKSKVVPSKTLELNWAIAEGDLAVKMMQMETFLMEGRRVEVLLARRKRARVVSQDECKALLKKVMEVAQRVPGAKEEKTEGSMGEKMSLVFENKKAKEKDPE
jgi:translation initiation factor IF-3